jgi:hypothetical protein
MLAITSRAGRWPLALTLAALAALAACTDDATAPTTSRPLRPNAAIADYFTVSNTNDSGIGSLRWVLSYADSGRTIRFDPALAGQTITLDSVLKMYLNDVTIEGPRDKGITISGGGKTRVLETWGHGPYTLRNLSITGGNANAAAILGSTHVVLENSSVHGNRGTTGVIALSRLTLVNSTVSGNSTDSTSGSAVQASQEIKLTNSTVAYNASKGLGGSYSYVLRNSIVSNNSGRNCSSGPTVLTQEGVNLSDDDSCGGPADIMIADPKLGPLADNGGPTMTHALVVGSPVINAGTSCTVPVDQRYAQRDAQCDLGAYEFADFTAVSVTIDPSVAVNQSNGWAVLTGTVTCSRSETFSLAVQLVQQQKVGKSESSVDAANIVPVECSTTPRPWVASMVLTSGSFQIGSATATAQSVNVEPWVTPASVTTLAKLYRSRK